MPEMRDWLFDAIWELSDKSVEMGLPGVAEKLEEAMDVYLIERPNSGEPVFQSRRRRSAKHTKRLTFAPVAMDLFVDPRRGAKSRLLKAAEKRRRG